MQAIACQTLVYANYLDTVTLPAIKLLEVLTDTYPCYFPLKTYEEEFYQCCPLAECSVSADFQWGCTDRHSKLLQPLMHPHLS